MYALEEGGGDPLLIYNWEGALTRTQRPMTANERERLVGCVACFFFNGEGVLKERREQGRLRE